MIKAIQDQVDAAKAAGKGKSQAGGQRASQRRKPKPTPKPEPQPEEEQVQEPQPLGPPDPRFYLSTTRTPDGHHSARLVGFSEAHWQQLSAYLVAEGFRPY